MGQKRFSIWDLSNADKSIPNANRVRNAFKGRFYHPTQIKAYHDIFVIKNQMQTKLKCLQDEIAYNECIGTDM